MSSINFINEYLSFSKLLRLNTELTKHLTFLVQVVLVLISIQSLSLLADESERVLPPSAQLSIVPVPNNFEPQPDYKPIKKEDFEALWKKYTNNITSRSRIKTAFYQAHFSENILTNGTFTFNVVSINEGVSQLALSPLSIQLSNLLWDESPAIWGTTPNQNSAVLVPQSGKLTGNWQVLNNRQDNKLRYKLQFPDAAITELELTIPNNLVLDSDKGVIRSVPSKLEGHSKWTISLGSATSCNISLTPRNLHESSKASLSCDELHAYSVMQEKLSITSKFTIHAATTSLNHLEFLAPKHLNIVSVKYAGVDNLHWEQVPNKDEQSDEKRIRILFSENLKGLEHSILVNAIGTLHSTSTTISSAPITLPRILLADSLTLNSTWELQVNKPLELQNFNATNLQLVSISETSNLRQLLKFQPLLANQKETSLSIELGWPKANAEVSQICFVEREGTEWLLTSEIKVSVEQGTLYEYDFHVPAGWDIVNVKEEFVSTSAASTLQWYDENADSKNKILKLVFSNGLSESYSKKIFITSRRQLSHAETELPLPFFQPLQGNLKTLLVFAPTSVTSSTANSGTNTVREIIPNDLPDEFLDFDLVSEGRFYQDGFRILHILNTNEVSFLQINIPEQLLDITVNSQIHINEVTTEEKVVIEIVPQGGSVSDFYVYSPSISNTYTFSSSIELTKQPIPIPVSRVPFWNLPENGQLWKIPLESAQTKPFELVLERSHSTPQFLSQSLPLVYLPGTSKFTGTVSVWNSSSQLPAVYSSTRARLKPINLRTISRSDGTIETPISFCNYLSPHEQYTFSIEESSQNRSSWLGCHLTLSTTIGESHNAPQQYEARYELPLIKDQKFMKLEWPENLNIVSIHLHDSKFMVPSGKREFEIQLDQFETGGDLVIRYHAQVENTGFLSREFDVVIPRISIPIVEFDWTIRTPNSELVEIKTSKGQEVLGNSTNSDRRSIPTLVSRNNIVQSKSTEATTLHLYHLPPELRFTTGITARINIIGCLTLIASALLAFYSGLFSNSTQNKICGTLLLFSICVHFILPLWLNLITGSLISGLILGWIISVSFRKINNTSEVIEKSEIAVPVGSTRSYPVVRTLVWFIFSCLFSSIPLLAEGSPLFDSKQPIQTTVETAPALPQKIFELPSKEILYIPSTLYSKLNQADKSIVSSSSFWIQHSGYNLQIDQDNGTQLTANFQVIVPTNKEHFSLFIPFDSAPSLDSCLVEGALHNDIYKTATGYRISLAQSSLKPNPTPPKETESEDSETELTEVKENSAPQLSSPNYRKLNIELNVFPATTTSTEEAYEISLNVPPVVESHLSIQTETLHNYFYVNSKLVNSDTKEKRQYSTHIENTNKLSIKWTEHPKLDVKPFSINKQTCVAQLQATEVQLQYAVDYSWNKPLQSTPKTMHFFNWRVPRNFSLQHLTFNKSPFNLNNVTIQDRGDFREYQFESTVSNLNQPPMIEALFSMPITNDKVELPAIQDRNILENADSFHVGIIREPNLLFSPQDLGTYKSIPNDAIETIFPKAASLRPQVVYQVPTSDKLILSITHPKNILNIDNRYKIEVSSDEIHWTCRYTIIPTQPLPQYLHQLVIPQSLNIDSVKVFENSTDLLGHWSQNQEKLNIFLNNSTNTEHEVVLEGTFGFIHDVTLNIPLITFKDHPIQNQTIRIFGTNSLDVDASNLNRSGNITSTLPNSRPNDRLVGAFSLQEGKTPQITVRKIKEHSPLKAISRIKRSSTNTYSVDLSILVPKQFTQDNLILNLPTSFDPEISKIQVSPTLDHKLVYNIKNQPRLQIPLVANRNTTYEINFSLTLPIPSKNSWAFETVTLPGNQPIQNYVYFRNQDFLMHSLNGINEVDSAQIKQDSFLNQLSASGDPVYQLADGIKQFDISTNVQKENHSAQVLFQHVDVKFSSNHTLLGKTTLFCRNTELYQLNFYWADDYNLRSATLNNQSISDSTTQPTELSFLAPAGINLITLNWEIPLVENNFGLRKTIPQLPLVKSHAGNSTLFSIDSPHLFIRINGLSLKDIDSHTYMLTRFEDLLQTWKSASKHEEASSQLSRIVGYYQFLKSIHIPRKYLTRFKKLEIQYRKTFPNTEGISPVPPTVAQTYLLLEPSVAGYRLTFTLIEDSTSVRLLFLFLLSSGGLFLYRLIHKHEWFIFCKENYSYSLSLILVGLLWWWYWIIPILGMALAIGTALYLLYGIGKQLTEKYGLENLSQ